MSEEDLYRDVILDHFKNPRNKGAIADCDIKAQGTNPFCGDELELDITMKDARVEAIRIITKGCAISQASASMMSTIAEGKTLQELKESIEVFRDKMLGAVGASWPNGWEEIESLEGVRKYPVRIKCALLAWNTLKEGIREYEAKGSKEKVDSHHQEEA